MASRDGDVATVAKLLSLPESSKFINSGDQARRLANTHTHKRYWIRYGIHYARAAGTPNESTVEQTACAGKLDGVVFAARHGHTPIVKLLLDKPGCMAKLDARDKV